MPVAEHPESELVRSAITIRAMDFPPNISMTKRSLLRWFALSTGLISERESRSTILDVLDAMFFLQISKGAEPTSREIMLLLHGRGRKISDKLLRYHLKRLLDMGLVQRKKLHYSFAHAPNAEKNDLRAGFSHNVTKRVSSSLAQIEQVLTGLAESYR